jgi:CheY-like chemotaxis protein
VSEQRPLSGLRILVVEDIFLVALDLADQLTDAGCDVIGPAATVRQALEKLDGAALDGALLDVDLGGERSFPVAEFLAARGIPFVFLTGYDSPTVFPKEFQQAPRLAKPLDAKVLASAVAALFVRDTSGDRIGRATS